MCQVCMFYNVLACVANALNLLYRLHKWFRRVGEPAATQATLYKQCLICSSSVNVWKLVAKLIGITYKSRMPKSDLQTKSCTSPNLSRLITPKVSHEKFLRMSDYRASSNPRFVLFCFFFLQQYTTKQSCHSEEKIKKILFLGVSELTQTLISADAYPRPS